MFPLLPSFATRSAVIRIKSGQQQQLLLAVSTPSIHSINSYTGFFVAKGEEGKTYCI